MLFSYFRFVLIVATLFQLAAAASETITGIIFCDNYFEFWFNGELIVKDAMDFCPHQAVNVSFTWDGVSDKTYAILCQDYMNDEYGDNGFEYVNAPVWDTEKKSCCFMNPQTLMLDSCMNVSKPDCPLSCPPIKGTGYWEAQDSWGTSDRCPENETCKGCGPWIGDGSLLAEFSDGTKTSKNWKVYVKSFGPTNASINAGCSYKNFGPCEVETFDTPAGWYTSEFDDSKWVDATEFTVEETGWGRSPTYNATSGECCGIRTQGRKPADPLCMTLPVEQCLNPKEVLCDKSGGAFCPGKECTSDGPQCDRDEDPRMIWAEDLQRAQQIFFRYTKAIDNKNIGSNDGGVSSSTGDNVSKSSMKTCAHTVFLLIVFLNLFFKGH